MYVPLWVDEINPFIAVSLCIILEAVSDTYGVMIEEDLEDSR